MPTWQGNLGLACQGNPGLAFLPIRFSKSVGRPNAKRLNESLETLQCGFPACHFVLP